MTCWLDAAESNDRVFKERLTSLPTDCMQDRGFAYLKIRKAMYNSEMSEQGNPPEIEPRPVTGLFRLSMVGVPLEYGADGKILPAGGEPRFAVKDVMVAHTLEGWNEFAAKLGVYLMGLESELYRGRRLSCVAESPMDELTDNMQSGEIRQVSQEEYKAAYLRKYGNAIMGPFFL